MSYACKILADSVNPHDDRLTTFEVTFPRIVLAEFNTHRMLSRNSASSRAIPVEKQIKRVMEDPFIPVYWGKNQKGMQAEKELSASEKEDAVNQWLWARRDAVLQAQRLAEIGVHKQITNRLLEPFIWHTVIASGTDWQNFFNLRCHKDAQPEIRQIAVMMRDAYQAGKPRELKEGEWHLPLVDWNGPDGEFLEGPLPANPLTGQQDDAAWTLAAKISAGRCARVSYLTHDGKRDPQADIDLCDRLVSSGHMSPLEHPAQAMNNGLMYGNFQGWLQYRKTILGEAVFQEKS